MDACNISTTNYRVTLVLLIVELLLCNHSWSQCQDFGSFLKTYKQKVVYDNIGKIPSTICSHNEVQQGMFNKFTGALIYEPPPVDSEIVYQKFPSNNRMDSYHGKIADCICQDSTDVYMMNDLTNYERKQLGEFRGHSNKVKLDTYFFDPIIGWQTWGFDEPTIEKDTIYEGIICFKLHQKIKNGTGYNEHFVAKSNYHLLISNIIKNNTLTQSHTFENYQITQGLYYPYKQIVRIYDDRNVVQKTTTVKNIVFDLPQPEKGLYDCTLKSHEIK